MTTLVLAGAGHAHARVLLEFGRRRPARLKKLLLVSPHALAPYSGMVPGWMAGRYRWEECCMDFRRLCRHAGADFIEDEIEQADADSSTLLLQSGQRLSYDWLSLNVGSTLHPPPGTGYVLPLRPLARLKTEWDSLQRRLEQLGSGQRFHIVMVGGGAAGVESVLATVQKARQAAPAAHVRFTLATAGSHLLPGLSRPAVRALQRVLDQAGVQIAYEFEAVSAEQGSVSARDGRRLPADAVLWATGAQAPDWLGASTLASNEKGFIRIDECLRSVSHPNVFAAGDCAEWSPPLPKAGVYAVRMGPVLASNLRAVVSGKEAGVYQPQRRHLVIIGTGTGAAVASWGRLGWHSRLAWRWKEYLDRKFLRTYAV